MAPARLSPTSAVVLRHIERGVNTPTRLRVLQVKHCNFYSKQPMDSLSSAAWYAQLIRPAFAPPAWIFGPVWSVLYLVIAISFGYVLWQTIRRQLPWTILLPFVLNLLFNAAYTPIQFGLKNNVLASVDILLVLGTLIWALVVIWPRVRWVAAVNIPYLLWVAFATVLQLTITTLNWS